MTTNTPNNHEEVREVIEAKLSRYFGCTPKEASKDQMYKAVAMTVKDILTQKRGDFKHEVNDKGAKRVYYMCMEFLLGRSLKTNLCNLGLQGAYTDVLKEMGFEMADWRLALWTLCPLRTIRLPDSLSATNTASLSR